MKDQGKKSPAVHTEVSGSGKKLVQARLPFKILASPVATATVENSSNESRKRKLSNEGDSTAPRKLLCTSAIKENFHCEDETVVLSDDGLNAPEVFKTISENMNPVVRLNKIDGLITQLTDKDGRIYLKTPKNTRKCGHNQQTTSINSPTSSASGKLLIKLPISERKKRKLSQRVNSSIEFETDTELNSQELNPGKKQAVSCVNGSLNSVKAIESISHESRKVENNLDNKYTEPPTKNSEICDSSIVIEDSLEENDVKIAEIDEKLNEDSQFEDHLILEEESDTEESVKSTESKSENESSKCTTPTRIVEGATKDESILIDDESDTEELMSSNEPSKLENVSSKCAKPAKDSITKTKVDSTPIAEGVHIEISPSQSSKPEIESSKDGTPLKASENKGKVPNKTLTPKQLKLLQKREDKQKQKEAEKLAKQKEKEEKERARKKEKEEKEEQKRRDKEEKEEQKRKEKEEKEEQKRKEKEEKEKKRLAELEAKNEERRQKEEEKRQKEEEKRRKEEDKRKKEEEAENKKRRAAEAFSKFFVPSKASKDPGIDEKISDTADGQNSTFVPFQVKRGMKLAPICRRCLDSSLKANLDKIMQYEIKDVPIENLYLNCLKTGKITPGKDTRTLSADEDNIDDCVLVADELEGAGVEIDEANRPLQKHRAKFFYFHENRRPPYYGTWRKKSETVKPRRPFAIDKAHFDYEVDSDDEWEEEDPGESLHGSDDEKESEDEYDVDNEFMVPHGHLSDEELQNEDELQDNSPEIQKARLKLLQAEFAQEMKKKTEKIKPRIVGIVWQDENGNKPELCSSVIWDSLNKRAMIFTDPPILIPPEKPESESVTSEKKQPLKRTKLTDEHIKHLIQLVHGNRHKKEFLIKEFQAYMSKKASEVEKPLVFKKSSVKEQIEKIAAWKVLEMDGAKKKKRLCWMVTADILKQYNLEGLGVVNKWEYILQPKRLEERHNELVPPTELVKSTEKVDEKVLKKKKKKKAHPAITMFTTVVSKETAKHSADTMNASYTVVENKKEESARFSLSKKQNSEEVLKTIPSNTMDTSLAAAAGVKSSNSHSSSIPVHKKRVALLMSVPRGQAIPEEKKSALISEFLKRRSETNKDPPDTKEPNAAPMEVETIALD